MSLDPTIELPQVTDRNRNDPNPRLRQIGILRKALQAMYESIASEINSIEPEFNYVISSSIVDATGDNTFVDMRTASWTKNYDRANVFSAGTITSPIDGALKINVSIAVSGVSASMTGIRLFIVTTSGSLNPIYLNAGTIQLNGNIKLTSNVDIEMSKNETAYIQIVVSGGTKVVDIDTETVISGTFV